MTGFDEGRGDPDPISVKIPVAVRLTGLSRSRIYELMRSGDIEYVKVGRSTLIPFENLREFIESRLAREIPGT
jgi:excisionase family DNA binding protein